MQQRGVAEEIEIGRVGMQSIRLQRVSQWHVLPAPAETLDGLHVYLVQGCRAVAAQAEQPVVAHQHDEGAGEHQPSAKRHGRSAEFEFEFETPQIRQAAEATNATRRRLAKAIEAHREAECFDAERFGTGGVDLPG